MDASRRSLLLLASIVVSVWPLRAQTPPALSGHWDGTIHMPGQEVLVAVDLANGSTGWIGSMSLPQSTAVDVPLSSITVEATHVRFTAGLPGSPSFEATLSADATSLSGEASNAEGSVPFELTRSGDADVKVPPPSSMLSNEFAGAWEGTLDVAGKAMRVAVTLSPAPDGTATATLISVDKGNLQIPVTTVTLQGNELVLEARAISGRYRGTLGAGGEIAGEWSEGSHSFPLTLRRSH